MSISIARKWWAVAVSCVLLLSVVVAFAFSSQATAAQYPTANTPPETEGYFIRLTSTSGTLVNSIREDDTVKLTARWNGVGHANGFNRYIYIYNISTGKGNYLDQAIISDDGSSFGAYANNTLVMSAAKLVGIEGGDCRILIFDESDTIPRTWEQIKTQVMSEIDQYLDSGSFPLYHRVSAFIDVKLVGKVNFSGTTTGNVGSAAQVNIQDFSPSFDITSAKWVSDTDSSRSFTISGLNWRTNASGNLSDASFVVPNCPAGNYHLTINDASNLESKTIGTYTVQSKASANASAVTIGNKLTVSGSGFEPGNLNIHFGNPATTNLGTATVAANGSFSVDVTIPTMEIGKYALYVVDKDGSAVSVGEIEVKAARIEIVNTNPTQIAFGDDLVLLAYDLIPGQTYYFKMGVIVGDFVTGSVTLGSAVASANGTIEISFEVDSKFEKMLDSYKICITESENSNEWKAVTSFIVQFKTAAPTENPSLVSPKPGANAGNPPSFSWSAVSAPGVFYVISFSTSENFSNIVFTDRVSGTSYQLAVDQLEKGTYYWMVVAYDGFGHNNSSVASNAASVKIGGGLSIGEIHWSIWAAIGAVVVLALAVIIYVLLRRRSVY